MASGARRRKSTIGASPLDAVVPQGAPPERGEEEEFREAGPSRTAVGETGVTQGERSLEEHQRARPVGKERLTVHVPAELSDRVKDAVYWTPGLTLARLAERALYAEMERLEAERGEPFPERAEELRGGRPRK